MKVSDVMMGTPPTCCRPDTSLSAAAEALWNRNCGILPIVDAQGEVSGVVTDRDMFIALATRNRLPSEMTVGEVASGKVYCCRADDDIHVALEIIGEKKVRRLPVLDEVGKLEGVLSMDDVVLRAEARTPAGELPELCFEDVMNTLKKLYGPKLPKLARKKTGYWAVSAH